MAQTRSAVITEERFLRYREKQDNDIRKEFERQSERFEISLATQIATAKHELTERFETSLETQIATVRNELKDEIKQVRDEIKGVKDEVGEMKGRLARMEGRSSNNLKDRPINRLEVIGVYRPDTGIFELPTYFPRTIAEFWKLTQPDRHNQLIYLVRFYSIEGYESWDIDDDDFDNLGGSFDETSHRDLSLEDAVRKYPSRAIDELATCIGVNLPKIRDFYTKLAQLREQQEQQAKAAKRMPIREKDDANVEMAKKKRFWSPSMGGPPMEPVDSTSSESELTRLEWDVQGREERRKALMDKLRAAEASKLLPVEEAAPSRRSLEDLSKSSEGSSTDPIPSQELLEKWAKSSHDH